MQRQAPGLFSLDRVTLDPGAAYTPSSATSTPLDSLAILVQNGTVTTDDPTAVPLLFTGDSATLSPDTTLQATPAGPATVLLVRVAGNG